MDNSEGIVSDKNLSRQLEAANPTDLIETVITLQEPGDPSKLLSPDETSAMTKEILEWVKEQTGEEPSDYNVFRNLQRFVVSASPTFTRKLLDNDKVASAMANRQTDSLEP